MKIWIHRYELVPRDAGAKPRSGALVKAEWAMGQVGYSDLHPWPEFGEPSLDEHVESLTSVNLTKLASLSLEYNYQDREFRLAKRNAFAGIVLPRVHKLVLDLDNLETAQLQAWQKQGFTHIKIKMGRDLARETDQLLQLAYATNLLWRLDFNARLSAPEFERWWTALDPAVQARIDFVEDPVGEEALRINGPWANDWKSLKNARVRVLKPAREPVEEFAMFDRVVFTHSFDHPFGQACALWSAANYYSRHPKKMDVCGLAAPEFYEPNEFSAVWCEDGPRLKPTTGFGFGFDSILEKLEWERVL